MVSPIAPVVAAIFIGTISAGAMRVDPDTAYRFARGEVVTFLGQPMQRGWSSPIWYTPRLGAGDSVMEER